MLLAFVPLSKADTLENLSLPPGFTVSVYADNILGARQMAVSQTGTVFVGSNSSGKVVALRDPGKKYVAAETLIIARDLNLSSGVAIREGALYVGEVNRISKFEQIELNLFRPVAAIVLEGLPTAKHHGTKYLRFGPDGKLYFPVGAPCDVCQPKDPRFASIMRVNPDGTALEIYARGVRSSVGLDFHPLTGELWFTDNGRDWLGEDLPPDELNRAPAPFMHFGFPHCFGKSVADPQFGKEARCADFSPPSFEFQAHVAPLGLHFYTGEQFPERYRNGAFVALHGSWNRSKKVGYELLFLKIEADSSITAETFLSGFVVGGDAWGRPVDIATLPDGSILVSDDLGGKIFRISYDGKK